MNETSRQASTKGDPARINIAYLPFAAPGKTVISELPTLADYRKTTPAGLDLPPLDSTAGRFTRKRVIVGLAVAAALHGALALAWWLSPPLRLKAGYAPERWIQVVPVPKTAMPQAPAPRRDSAFRPPRSSSAPPRWRGEPPH